MNLLECGVYVLIRNMKVEAGVFYVKDDGSPRHLLLGSANVWYVCYRICEEIKNTRFCREKGTWGESYLLEEVFQRHTGLDSEDVRLGNRHPREKYRYCSVSRVGR